MSVIGSNVLVGSSGQGGGYNLTKSLRFRSSASAYLNRTPASAGNRQTWTWSSWIKRGTLGTEQRILFANDNGLAHAALMFNSNNTLQLVDYTDPTFDPSGQTWLITTSAVYRDPSAWYHIVAVFDTTNATSSNRMKLYVNGSQITAFSSTNYPTQNYQGYVNNNVLHGIGARIASPISNYYDGYMAEINMVDGQALTPSSFGETSTTTGVWIPKKYTGTYGTNGFYLPFTDTTSTSTLGTDFSGNSNTWTVNNISLTSGSTYDSMNDVPTLTSATTANYSVLNPVSNLGNGSISNGNLGYVATTFGWVSAAGTTFVSSGKWYYEVTLTTFSGGGGAMIGVCNTGFTAFNSYAGSTANSWSVQASESTTNKWNNNSSTLLATEVSAVSDVFMLAYDVDAGKVWFGRNGTWYSSGDPAAGTNAAFTNLSGSLGVVVSSISTTSAVAVNCGQRPFSYTPPTGFVALNTFNLPTPTIGATASSQANKYFDATTYTGNGTSGRVLGNSGGFQADLVWIKGRSVAWNHQLADIIRGGGKSLQSNLTDAEVTNEQYGYVSAFSSSGFTLTTGSLGADLVNNNTSPYVAWQWKANGSGVTNTAGSITSTVSANTTAGFSIVTYTGTGANATVGHGLGAVPSMYIVKRRNAAGDNWATYHISTGNTNFLRLDTTNAAQTFNLWQNTTPTSSVFYLTSDVGVNGSGSTFVAYCFAQVADYSAFGSYTGTGSTDGTFVFTGFRPRFVMFKRTDAVEQWAIRDTARDTYNATELELFPNLSNAEEDNNLGIDLLSNGFKIRNSANRYNASGGTYIYMAFCESPFRYANAR